ncbi:MAG: hypothetical protein LBP19_10145 [Treponema sp.]|nr:hypothetical protein [Treponema sp.]
MGTRRRGDYSRERRRHPRHALRELPEEQKWTHTGYTGLSGMLKAVSITSFSSS